jgi:hypothetical protein
MIYGHVPLSAARPFLFFVRRPAGATCTDIMTAPQSLYHCSGKKASPKKTLPSVMQLCYNILNYYGIVFVPPSAADLRKEERL